jgi:hypothetical protein
MLEGCQKIADDCVQRADDPGRPFCEPVRGYLLCGPWNLGLRTRHQRRRIASNTGFVTSPTISGRCSF